MKQMNFREELSKYTPRLRNGYPGKIYIFGIGSEWEIIHELYLNVLNVELTDHIFAFIDNDPNKQGISYMSCPVIPPSKIDNENAVVLIASWKHHNEMATDLDKLGLICCSSFFYQEQFHWILKRFIYSETAAFSNTVDGGRCFLIGNGPSLLVEDLEILHRNNEVSFGVNGITKIFEKTTWRPTFYFCSDVNVWCEIKNDLEQLNCPQFFASYFETENRFSKNVYYFDEDQSTYFYNYPHCFKFSNNIENIYRGGTVLYLVLQAAVSMGFNEIYLLGTDNKFPIEVLHDGTVVDHGNVLSHFYKGEISLKFYTTPIESMLASFAFARKYCEEHGIKIYNATRGGALEVFDRVEFSNLFYNR